MFLAEELKTGLPARFARRAGKAGGKIAGYPFVMDKASLIPDQIIEKKIFLIRGQKVMLDRDLAELYDVPTKALNQAVKRKRDRFPEDFMFSLTRKELLRMSQFVASPSRSQFVTLKRGKNIKYLPHAFTEQGIAMLSSVLNSERAVQVNIVIMRAFVKFREILASNKDMAHKLAELERRVEKNEIETKAVFDAIRQLMSPPEKPKRRIGFLADREEQ